MPNCYCLNPVCPQPENPPDALVCRACGNPLLIRNRYRAFKRIGQGGFGATFLARDQDLPSKPWRVIKQLRPVENSPQIAELAKELFHREAEVLEKLGEHSQIPKLFAHFEENDKFYLVQEFIQGVTLSHELQRNGPMTEEQVRQVLQETLLILSYVHSNHTVHRDIKPANLIRRKADQRLVLIDFGAVKDLNPKRQDSPAEVTAIRSLGFSPPEQVSGHSVVPASDIYALGATCLNLMTMESPAKFYDHDVNQWDWSGRLQLSHDFDALLRRMLDPALNGRFASATEVLRALQELSSEDPASKQSVVLLPQSYGTQTPSPTSMISSHWSIRRSEGFQPTPIPRTSPPSGGQTTPTTGFGSNPRGYGNNGNSITGLTSISRQPAGLARTQPTAPRVPSLAGADLRSRLMVKQNLAGRDLRKADIRGTDFTGSNLQRADLRGVIFNTPKPTWMRVLGWLFGQAQTLGGVAMGLMGLFGSAIFGFVLTQMLLDSLWVSSIAGVFGAMAAWAMIWSLAGGTSFGHYNKEQRKRYTCMRRVDLRGAQMDEKLKTFARRQGALLD